MSDLISWSTVLFGFVMILLWLWKQRWNKELSGLPPGPPRVPLLGNLIQARGPGMDGLRHMARLVDKYGKDGVATFQFGLAKPWILVQDYETIKRLFNESAFAGRPLVIVQDSFFHRQGLFFTDGELSKEHRRFALATLRDFGMGKTWLQDMIMEEARDMVSEIQALNGVSVNPTDIITPCVANVICAIAYGKRFSHNDERFRQLAALVGENIRIMSKTQLLEIFPFLRFIPFNKYRRMLQQRIKNAQKLAAFMQSLVDEHKATFRPGADEPTDYIDAFLKQQYNQRNNSDSTFTNSQLILSIINLFGAGTESTSTTLTWAILYLIKNPAVHLKMQREIAGVLDERLFPTLEDKDKLPYSQATILEALRIATLVPLIGRRSMVNVELNGYQIPKSTPVFAMASAVHENPDYFPEPQIFKPERFLDNAGRIRHKVDGLLFFGLGKRVCLGESMAKMELFLFFVTLVRNFNFHVPPGEVVTTDDSIVGLVNSPKPFKISFLSRG